MCNFMLILQQIDEGPEKIYPPRNESCQNFLEVDG